MSSELVHLYFDPHIRLVPALAARGGSLNLLLAFDICRRLCFMMVIFFQRTRYHHFRFVAAVFTSADLLDLLYGVAHLLPPLIKSF